MTLYGCIYLVTHKKSGKKYVGQHQFADPSGRWEEHIKESKSIRVKYMFHKALAKYGKDAFTWEVLLVCRHDALDEMEGYYADQFGSYYTDTNEAGYVAGGYNMAWCGEFTSRGIKRSAEACANMSKSQKGKRLGDKNPSRLHPESLPRGDNHYSRTNPEKLARGERHGSVIHPERVPRGENNGARKHPERMARGDNHPSRLHPERLARGDRSGRRLHPERYPTGDNHYSRTNPEKMARGDQNGSRTHPERLKRGEDVVGSILNPDKVRIIRVLYDSDMGFSHIKLGAMFRVSDVSIRNVITRKTWKHVQ